MSSKIRGFLGVLALLGACGCSTILNFGSSDLSRLRDAVPTGTPFEKEQFRDYAYLARSFGDSPSGELESLAGEFATKAMTAASGEDALPEEPQNAAERQASARLAHVLESGRSTHPAEAATAQAQYDCWILNGRVSAQARSARACHTAFEDAVAGLEAQSP